MGCPPVGFRYQSHRFTKSYEVSYGQLDVNYLSTTISTTIPAITTIVAMITIIRIIIAVMTIKAESPHQRWVRFRVEV